MIHYLHSSILITVNILAVFYKLKHDKGSGINKAIIVL